MFFTLFWESTMPRTKTIAQMRKELAIKERQLRRLVARRRKVANLLEQIDRQIVAIGGEAAGPGTRRRKKAAKRKPRGKAKVARRAKRRRGAARKPVVEYIKRVLRRASDGMRARDVAAAVRKAGYPTKSKDFYSIVATTLATDSRFKRIRRGVYKLAG